MESAPSEFHRDPLGRIETEEPDAGEVAMPDICPHVDLREPAQRPESRQATWRDVFHEERHDADVRLAVEGVDVEPRWDQAPERPDVDPPMREEQVTPAHPHDPRPAA